MQDGVLARLAHRQPGYLRRVQIDWGAFRKPWLGFREQTESFSSTKTLELLKRPGARSRRFER